MSKLIANLVRKELKKLAFFVQYSGMLEELTVRLKNKLEDLPVEWTDSPRFEGSWIPKWDVDQKETWSEAFLKGELLDHPVELIIKRDDDRYEYSFIYKGKKYKTNNLTKLQNSVRSIADGKKPLQEKLSDTYKMLSNKKEEISTYIKTYYLKDLSSKNWQMKLTKDVSHIYLKFFILGTEEQDSINEKLVEHDYHRVYSTISYLKILIKRLGLDPKALSFKPSLIKSGTQSGFKITIK